MHLLKPRVKLIRSSTIQTPDYTNAASLGGACVSNPGATEVDK